MAIAWLADETSILIGQINTKKSFMSTDIKDFCRKSCRICGRLYILYNTKTTINY